MGDYRTSIYRVLVGKPEEKKLLGRPKHRWEDNIKMDLQEVGSCGMDWIELAQVRDRCRTLVNAVMNRKKEIRKTEGRHGATVRYSQQNYEQCVRISDNVVAC
jgi:hypothetical protein